MMQMAGDQVIHMVTVRHRRVPAARAMHVIRRMCSAGMLRRAGVGVRRRHGNHVFIHVVAVGMVEVTIVKIVDVSFVPDGHVPAMGAMLVVMIGVVGLAASRHGEPLVGGKRCATQAEASAA